MGLASPYHVGQRTSWRTCVVVGIGSHSGRESERVWASACAWALESGHAQGSTKWRSGGGRVRWRSGGLPCHQEPVCVYVCVCSRNGGGGDN